MGLLGVDISFAISRSVVSTERNQNAIEVNGVMVLLNVSVNSTDRWGINPSEVLL